MSETAAVKSQATMVTQEDAEVTESEDNQALVIVHFCTKLAIYYDPTCLRHQQSLCNDQGLYSK